MRRARQKAGIGTERNQQLQPVSAAAIPNVLRKPWIVLTPTQETALELYQLGLNVSAQPYGRKAGFPHRRLQITRLYYDEDDPQPDDLLHVTAGRCNLIVMTGRTSRNLFILDCETGPCLHHFIEQLQERDVALWVVRSPGARGGGHIYLLSADGDVANIPSRVHRDFEVRGTRNYVLAVGSVHPEPGDPLNTTYQWYIREGDAVPSVTLKQLDGILDVDSRPIALTLRRRRPASIVPRYPFTAHSRKTAEYLRNGHLIPAGAGRRNALYEVACDYARCNVSQYEGYTREDALDDLADVARRSGLPDAEIRRAIDEAYRKMDKGTYKVDGKRGRNAYSWQYALAFCDAHHWQGRTAASDRAVMLALIECARDSGNDNGTFRASVRELSERARVNKETAGAAIKRLQRASPPLLCYAGQEGGGTRTSSNERRASLWRFSDYVVREGWKCGGIRTVRSTYNGLSSSVRISPDLDAAERGALGVQGWHVYRVLLTFDAPATLREIAERAQMTVDQVRYHISGSKKGGGKLMAFRLVVRSGRRYTALPATEADLDERIAQPAGTLGKGAYRRRVNARERALYAGALIIRTRIRSDYDNFSDHAVEADGGSSVQRPGRSKRNPFSRETKGRRA